ncbi:hypothetical protein Lser_V15G20589 [Lactuca serriola]
MSYRLTAKLKSDAPTKRCTDVLSLYVASFSSQVKTKI